MWAKYRDDFVRTENGWKIKKRYLDTIHAGGNMNLFAEAAEAAGPHGQRVDASRGRAPDDRRPHARAE